MPRDAVSRTANEKLVTIVANRHLNHPVSDAGHIYIHVYIYTRINIYSYAYMYTHINLC